MQYFHSYDIFYFDYGELLREPWSLHSLIRSLILRVILVWKHFNFPTLLHVCILYVCVKFKNDHNIFLAHPMRPIFVEDTTKVENSNHFSVS